MGGRGSQGPWLTMMPVMMPETEEMVPICLPLILGSSTYMPVIHLLGRLVASRERRSHRTPAWAIEFRA